MTLEELYWWRVERLWTMYNSITNDEVYKSMWERKLKELLLLLVCRHSSLNSTTYFRKSFFFYV